MFEGSGAGERERLLAGELLERAAGRGPAAGSGLLDAPALLPALRALLPGLLERQPGQFGAAVLARALRGCAAAPELLEAATRGSPWLAGPLAAAVLYGGWEAGAAQSALRALFPHLPPSLVLSDPRLLDLELEAAATGRGSAGAGGGGEASSSGSGRSASAAAALGCACFGNRNSSASMLLAGALERDSRGGGEAGEAGIGGTQGEGVEEEGAHCAPFTAAVRAATWLHLNGTPRPPPSLSTLMSSPRGQEALARARPGGPTAKAVLFLALVEQGLDFFFRAEPAEGGKGGGVGGALESDLARLRADLPEGGELARTLTSAPAAVAMVEAFYGLPPEGAVLFTGSQSQAGRSASVAAMEAAKVEALAASFRLEEAKAGESLRVCLTQNAQYEAVRVLRACGVFLRSQGRLPVGFVQDLVECGLLREAPGGFMVAERGGATPILASDPVLAWAAEKASQTLVEGETPAGSSCYKHLGAPAAELLRELEGLAGRWGHLLPLGESLRARQPAAGGAAGALMAAAESVFLLALEDRCKHVEPAGGCELEGCPAPGARAAAAQAHSEACAACLQAAVERPEVAEFVRFKSCTRSLLEVAVPELLPEGSVQRMFATNAVPTMAALLQEGVPRADEVDLTIAAALEAARSKRRRGAATPVAELGQLLERARAANAAGDADTGALALGLLLGPCLLRGSLRGAALAEVQGALGRVCAVYGPICAGARMRCPT